MDSKACTLVLDPSAKETHAGRYLCRPAAGACEEGLAQSDLSRGPSREAADLSAKLCTDRPGCVFQSNDCYCDCRGYGKTATDDGVEAPPCLCFCAGGAPDRCEPGQG